MSGLSVVGGRKEENSGFVSITCTSRTTVTRCLSIVTAALGDNGWDTAQLSLDSFLRQDANDSRLTVMYILQGHV
jgi:hypothetical protein